MMELRKAGERGHLDFGWLDTYHTFSFGSYFDPKHMGFSNLRVINDDTIKGGFGFDTHPHRDMEIITFVKEGAVEHRDTLGNFSVIRPGEIQIMSAGTGIQHSEHNFLKHGDTKMYQVWIQPEKLGVEPRYEQYDYTHRIVEDGLTQLVSPQGGEGIASIHADSFVSLGTWRKGGEVKLSLKSERSYWIQMVDGVLDIGGRSIAAGDGIGLKRKKLLEASAAENTSFLLFDLP